MCSSLEITHIIPHERAEQTMSEIESLARKVYQSSSVLSADTLLRWYQCNPSMWWLAKMDNHLIGYFSAIPLKNEAFKKTLQPEFDETTDITADSIRTWNDGVDEKYSLYICSMAVHPDYRKRSDLPIFRLIVQHFLESLLTYGKNKSIVTEWSGLAVSTGGCHVLEHYFHLRYLTDDNHHHQIWYGQTNMEHQEKLLQKIRQKLFS